MKSREKVTADVENFKASKLKKNKAQGKVFYKISNLNKKVALFRKNEERLKFKSELRIQ